MATPTSDPPSLTAMACLHHTLGIEAPLGQCLAVKQGGGQDGGDVGHLSEDPGADVWCVDNAAATFTVTTAAEGTNPKGGLYPLLHTCLCVPTLLQHIHLLCTGLCVHVLAAAVLIADKQQMMVLLPHQLD